MQDLKKPYFAILVDNIKHQGIGGQQIRIEKEGTMKYIYDTYMNDYTIAMYNFILRRPDIMSTNMLEDGTLDNENTKIFYGHINGLGYFIAEDEIKEVLKNE